MRSSRTRWPKIARGSELPTLWSCWTVDHYESTHDECDNALVYKPINAQAARRRGGMAYVIAQMAICRENGLGPFPGHAQDAGIPVRLPPGAARPDSARAILPNHPPLG